MDARNDQLTDHQGLVERLNLAADKAQLAMDQADRTSADGGTLDLTDLRAAVTDMISASHGFEALMKAGVTPQREGAADDGKPAAKSSGSPSGTSSGSGTSSSSGSAGSSSSSGTSKS